MAETKPQGKENQKPKSKKSEEKGLVFHRYFSKEEVHPYDEVKWEKKSAQITNENGEVIFEQRDVEMPSSWSQLATNVVVSKYFKGKLGTEQRENSLKTLISRVVDNISEWGRKDGYFATDDDADRFRDELAALVLHQRMAFNSPVWFNVGVEEEPQCSACFINSVEDTMESIMDLAKTEGMLFKFGSGAGSNLSTLRSSVEQMSTGGYASGPVSFMKGYDAFAGVIKSGGKTRRAAKMVILNHDHPDIMEFVESKVKEEQKAKALIAQGYDSSFNGEAYSSIFFQNANHSVRVTDDFMQAYQSDSSFGTKAVTTGETVQTMSAQELMDKISQAAWETGDPGLQFDTTINDWHTCSVTDRIYASNPCSEYMFLNDTACNLASLNLMTFRDEAGDFDVEAFRRAVRITITAMEIIIDNASYPSDKIKENSRLFRTLGLGYANLGALLMSRSLPYDSDDGRAYAAAITALMHGEAYRTSSEIAAGMGPFKEYKKNRRSMLRVIRKHSNAVERIDQERVPAFIMDTVRDVYDELLARGERDGFRNAQVTVLAPTGTIAFMMDCDTTGIEPDIALVKYKKLVGGGLLKIVNRTVPEALHRMGYDDRSIKRIVDYIDANDTIEGAPGLKDEHLPVFDCAFKPYKGQRAIHYMGHVRMMAAVQPFLSGAISKTVNMPNHATADEIAQTYTQAWQMGLKAIAIYRDGCKASQPLNTSKEEKQAESDEKKEAKAKKRMLRHKLPDERQAITHKFTVGGHEGYITVGMYENGQPGEIFIVMSKEGSAVSGLMDSFATSISLALQYGVPLKVLVRKFIHTRFEPSGFTNNPAIPIAKSVMDYIFRWLALKFMPAEEHGLSEPPDSDENGIEVTTAPPDEDRKTVETTAAPSNGRNGGAHSSEDDTPVRRESGKTTRSEPGVKNGTKVLKEAESIVLEITDQQDSSIHVETDAPPCPECGAITTRSGSCYRCHNCGATTGCS
ncbi:vitamin B12-dependent ribonucleotide reductase [bacterium]|nr:vitamin B12-dependent ribonucleotide reductase [bacterium]